MTKKDAQHPKRRARTTRSICTRSKSVTRESEAKTLPNAQGGGPTMPYCADFACFRSASLLCLSFPGVFPINQCGIMMTTLRIPFVHQQRVHIRVLACMNNDTSVHWYLLPVLAFQALQHGLKSYLACNYSPLHSNPVRSALAACDTSRVSHWPQKRTPEKRNALASCSCTQPHALTLTSK